MLKQLFLRNKNYHCQGQRFPWITTLTLPSSQTPTTYGNASLQPIYPPSCVCVCVCVWSRDLSVSPLYLNMRVTIRVVRCDTGTGLVVDDGGLLVHWRPVICLLPVSSPATTLPTPSNTGERSETLQGSLWLKNYQTVTHANVLQPFTPQQMCSDVRQGLHQSHACSILCLIAKPACPCTYSHDDRSEGTM